MVQPIDDFAGRRVILGRKRCGHCGFASAHVRQRPGGHPYVYCPECGLSTHARNGYQAKLITAGMRPEGGARAPVVPSSSSDILVPATRPAESQVASWLDQLLLKATHGTDQRGRTGQAHAARDPRGHARTSHRCR